MSWSVSSDGFRVMPRAALFTQTSIRPNRASACPPPRPPSSRGVTSATIARARPPHRAATAWSASFRRATSTTDAPRDASSRAVAAPMPPLAPVITTTLSCTAASALPLREEPRRELGRLERRVPGVVADARELAVPHGGPRPPQGLHHRARRLHRHHGVGVAVEDPEGNPADPLRDHRFGGPAVVRDEPAERALAAGEAADHDGRREPLRAVIGEKPRPLPAHPPSGEV